MKTAKSNGPRLGRGAAVCLALASWLAANCSVPEPETLEPRLPSAASKERVAEARSAQSSCIVLRRGLEGQVEDALVNADPTKAANNYGTSVSLTAGGGAPARHALVKWDVGSIPPSSTVTSATASLRVLLYGGALVHAHRLTAPWDQPLVTWSSYPEATPVTPTLVDFPDAAAGQSAVADLTQMVQDWVSGASANHGLLLERDDAAGATVYASSEADDEDARPALQVCYTAPPSVTAGAAVDQLVTLPGIEVQVLAGTQIQVGGMPVTGPLDMIVQKSADPSQAPSGPLSEDEDEPGTIMNGTDFPLFPVYHFGPAGATFNPPLLVTIDVPRGLNEPTAWLCDDTGNHCERRGGMFYDDTQVSPPKSRLYVEIDHFSNLVITDRYPVGIANLNDGPVMKGTVNMYYIWYGDWSGNSAPTILTDFANSAGGSPWMLINTAYSDSGGLVSGNVSYAGSADVPASATYGNLALSETAIRQIVRDVINGGTLPKDANGVYFVITAANVTHTKNSGAQFCSKFCGWHTYTTIGGVPIKYAFVGNPITQCPASACVPQSLKSPNGNPGADAVVSTLAHELAEAVTSPEISGWEDANLNENADKCAFQYGAKYVVANGSQANMKLGARDYLIQQNWDPAKGVCATSAPQFQGCTVTTPNGTACDDGNACTQTDVCVNGTCVGSNPVTCVASDQCHNPGTCNSLTGCSNPAKANGTACNDSNACTQTDTCQNGACVGANIKTCAASDQCHNAGTCNPATGTCSNPAKADGAPCNDGDACTATDACQSGACVGSGSACGPGSGLTQGGAGVSCQDILAAFPASQSGVYWVKPGAGPAFQAYCDMTTDGGGWTLALAYNHIGGQNAVLVPGVVPQSPTAGYSHMATAQMQALGPIDEARFYCQTSTHKRKVHFKTNDAGSIGYMLGTGSNAVSHWQSGVTPLTGHSAFLPAAVDEVFSQSGEDRMTNFPFYKAFNYHWGIQGLGNRWECDDFPANASATTLHQIWVRPGSGSAGDGLYQGTAATSCNALHTAFPASPSGVYWLKPSAGVPAYQGYCDMTTDGGGWNLALAYAHPGGQNAPLVPGVAPQSPTAGYSHMSIAQMQGLGPIGEARFYCHTNTHTDKIHFKSNNAGVIAYLRGTGSNAVANWQSGITALSGHSAFLPATTDSVFDQSGEDRMTTFPFYSAYLYHWGIQGFGNRWECDDWPGNEWATTLHQVWVRVAGGTPADGLTQATAATSCNAIHVAFPASPSGVYWLKPPTAPAAFQGYCDMATDGGGWTLALAYSHAGGQNAPLAPGVPPQSPTAGYSHMSTAQLQSLGSVGEARFYCETSAHSDKLHFKTSNAGVISYIRGTGPNAVVYWLPDNTALPGQSAYLPSYTDAVFNQVGEDRMTTFPFYRSGYFHWGIQGLGNRWECDDWAGDASATTLHQVWMR